MSSYLDFEQTNKQNSKNSKVYKELRELFKHLSAKHSSNWTWLVEQGSAFP